MANYNRKSKTIDVIQWTGSNEAAIEAFTGKTAVVHKIMSIETNTIKENSWIEKKANGSIVVYSETEFNDTYEE